MASLPVSVLDITSEMMSGDQMIGIHAKSLVPNYPTEFIVTPGLGLVSRGKVSNGS
jgi:hypothetical protein